VAVSVSLATASAPAGTVMDAVPLFKEVAPEL
jgi:hypothetical protein